MTTNLTHRNPFIRTTSKNSEYNWRFPNVPEPNLPKKDLPNGITQCPAPTTFQHVPKPSKTVRSFQRFSHRQQQIPDLPASEKISTFHPNHRPAEAEHHRTEPNMTEQT